MGGTPNDRAFSRYRPTCRRCEPRSWPSTRRASSSLGAVMPVHPRRPKEHVRAVAGVASGRPYAVRPTAPPVGPRDSRRDDAPARTGTIGKSNAETVNGDPFGRRDRAPAPSHRERDRILRGPNRIRRISSEGARWPTDRESPTRTVRRTPTSGRVRFPQWCRRATGKPIGQAA